MGSAGLPHARAQCRRLQLRRPAARGERHPFFWLEKSGGQAREQRASARPERDVLAAPAQLIATATDAPIDPAHVAHDPHSAYALIRRLLTEYALAQWKRYALAFCLMGVAAAGTAATAYLAGDVINQAYVNRNFVRVYQLGVIVVIVFALRGARDLRPRGDAVAHRQQHRCREPAAPVRQAAAAQSRLLRRPPQLRIHRAAFDRRGRRHQVLNLLISAVGRDFFSLIGSDRGDGDAGPGDVARRLRHRAAGAAACLRKLIRRIRTVAHSQWTGGTRILETLQETLQGIRIVKSFTLEDAMRAALRRQRRRGRARIQQDGARRPARRAR